MHEQTISDHKRRVVRPCAGLTKAGDRCHAAAMQDSELCAFHDPRLSDRLAESRRHGGRHSHTSDPPVTAASQEALPIIPTFRKAGRNTTLTPELQDAVCFNIINGRPILMATMLADIPDRTFYDWKKRGSAGEEPYAIFLEACQKAEDSFIGTLMDVIARQVRRRLETSLGAHAVTNAQDHGRDNERTAESQRHHH